jgi:hypothetical protein
MESLIPVAKDAMFIPVGSAAHFPSSPALLGSPLPFSPYLLLVFPYDREPTPFCPLIKFLKCQRTKKHKGQLWWWNCLVSWQCWIYKAICMCGKITWKIHTCTHSVHKWLHVRKPLVICINVNIRVVVYHWRKEGNVYMESLHIIIIIIITTGIELRALHLIGRCSTT